MSTRMTPVVLVADDEPSMLALVARHVRTLGYEVLEASDGEAAWQEAENSLPDLVVLDVMMPGMSGWEVCRRIRESVGLHHTGVIMLTGIGQSLNELTSPLYGADAYIDKPFEFKDLDTKIQKVLQARGHEALGVEPPPSAEPGTSSAPPEAAVSLTHSAADEIEDEKEAPMDAWSGKGAAGLPSFHDASREASVSHINNEDELAPIDELALSANVKHDDAEDEFSMAVTLRPPPPARTAVGAIPQPSPVPQAANQDEEEDEDEDEPVTQRPTDLRSEPVEAPKKAAKKPAKKATKKAIKTVAKKPAKKATKAVAKKLAKKPAKKAAKTIAKKPAKNVAKKAAKKATKTVAKKPAKKATKTVAKKPVKKATKTVAKKPAKKATKTVAKKPAKKATKTVAKKPAKKARAKR